MGARGEGEEKGGRGMGEKVRRGEGMGAKGEGEEKVGRGMGEKVRRRGGGGWGRGEKVEGNRNELSGKEDRWGDEGGEMGEGVVVRGEGEERGVRGMGVRGMGVKGEGEMKEGRWGRGDGGRRKRGDTMQTLCLLEQLIVSRSKGKATIPPSLSPSLLPSLPPTLAT